MKTQYHFPQHVAIIIDGNRRWAKAKGLPTFFGHKEVYEKIKEVTQWLLDRGILIITVYAFSTENWNRSKQEISYLMQLLESALTKDLKILHKKGVCLRVIGKREELSLALRRAITKAEQTTKGNNRGILNLAINYGGRSEITEAVKKIAQEGVSPFKIDAALIGKYLWTAGLPDPDLIIRTAGEQRLSGFLTWQSVYSEMYFSKVYWPEFSEKDLDEALKWYASRERRFGK